MNVRRGSLGILVVCLVWFTATRVGAIWQAQPTPSAVKDAMGTKVSYDARIAQDLTGREAALLQRVDLRLRQNPLDYEASLLKGLLYFKAGDLFHGERACEKLVARSGPEVAHELFEVCQVLVVEQRYVLLICPFPIGIGQDYVRSEHYQTNLPSRLCWELSLHRKCERFPFQFMFAEFLFKRRVLLGCLKRLAFYGNRDLVVDRHAVYLALGAPVGSR